jgi:ABC-type uncharacterized transport system substrate-binding protein
MEQVKKDSKSSAKKAISVPLKGHVFDANGITIAKDALNFNGSNYKIEKLKKDKKIRILMLLWRGETEAERGFLDELKHLGYQITLTTINIDHNLKRLKQILHNELSPQNYDYIYTFGTLVSLVASEWTKNITPLVFNAVSYPIHSGLIARGEGHNGGNLSGIGISAPMDMQIKNLAVLVNPAEQNSLDTCGILEELAKASLITVERFEVRDEEEILKVLEKIRSKKIFDGIYVTSASLFMENSGSIFDFGREAKIPMIAEQIDMVKKGALLGTIASYESAGKTVAKIIDMNYINGIAMSNIPVQHSDFFCIVNRRTAEILGINLNTEEIGTAFQFVFYDQ